MSDMFCQLRRNSRGCSLRVVQSKESVTIESVIFANAGMEKNLTMSRFKSYSCSWVGADERA